MDIRLSIIHSSPSPWREFLERASKSEWSKDTHVEVHIFDTINDIRTERMTIQLGEIPSVDAMCKLESRAEAQDWDYLGRAQELSSLDENANLDFTVLSSHYAAWEEYGTEDLNRMREKYPGFNEWPDPLFYSDFDMYERRGFLWLASRAIVDGKPALLCRAAPNFDFGVNTDIRGFAWALLDRDTGRYKEWRSSSSLSVPYGEMCEKFINELELPAEPSVGIDWLVEARRLKSMDCLLSYSSDFLWHDHNILMRNNGKPIAVIANRSGTWYLDHGEVPNYMENAAACAMHGSCNALIVLSENNCNIQDVRGMPVNEKADLLQKTVASMPKASPYYGNPLVAKDNGDTIVAVADYNDRNKIVDWHFESKSMNAPIWCRVKHPEIPCRPQEEEEPVASPSM